jgi:transposase
MDLEVTMQYHANAALTAIQRAQVRRLYRDGASQSELARRFGVHRRTIQRWIGRTDTADRSCAPKQHGRQVVSDAYREAVVALRQAYPTYGPKRIAHELRQRFPTANVATVWRILNAAGLSKRAPKKTDAPTNPSRKASSSTGHPRVTGD